jgi:hypothetical protein
VEIRRRGKGKGGRGKGEGARGKGERERGKGERGKGKGEGGREKGFKYRTYAKTFSNSYFFVSFSDETLRECVLCGSLLQN